LKNRLKLPSLAPSAARRNPVEAGNAFLEALTVARPQDPLTPTCEDDSMAPNRTKSMQTVAALFSVLLVPATWFAPSALGADDLERAQLAHLLRQLDQLERSAAYSETLSRGDVGRRYHFDYARLQRDIERVRSGIQQYLAPSRAQPRDPAALLGDYRRDAKPSAPDTESAP
jgi:RAQPRD family integrative conjugative element protein